MNEEIFNQISSASTILFFAFGVLLLVAYIGNLIFQWIDDAPLKNTSNPIIDWMMKKRGFTRENRYGYIAWRDNQERSRDPFFLVIFVGMFFAVLPWLAFFAFCFPFVPCSIGLLIGLAYLARSVRRANKVFKTHVQTPADQAHLRSETVSDA